MNKSTTENSQKAISVNRTIYSHFYSIDTPTIVFFAGIHGNEPAGVFALSDVFKNISSKSIKLKGNIYALAGNISALQKQVRFQTEDLNRMWTVENISKILQSNNTQNQEEKELLSLLSNIKSILKKHPKNVTFIDLHTTSANTIPFITISDSLNNRTFAAKFNFPIILGIEEYLEGPLLTYINEFGHTSLGFEAGQHNSKEAIANCKFFIQQILIKSNIINHEEEEFTKLYISQNNSHLRGFFEIDYLYKIKENEDFKMFNGFENFDVISKKTPVAISNNEKIKSLMNGRIFMPLYQKQGKEGFFIIKKVSIFWLKLSAIVRKLNLHHVLRLLLGVKKHPKDKHVLIVNSKTAKYLADEIFHLFGYRKKINKGKILLYIKRDREITIFK